MDGPEFAVVPVEVKTKSKRRKIITIISVCLGILVLLGGAYSSLIYFVLLDYVTMPYITFSYRSDLADESQITVTIDRVYSDSDYPARFRVPRKLMGYPVTAIGPSAFAGLERLEEVIFPETIVSIGENAFNNCVNLTKFNVPSALDYIGTDAFNNTAYIANYPDDAVIIGSILYTYKGIFETDTAIVKSEDSPAISAHDHYFNLGNFDQIGAGVFANQPGITYAEFPDNLETISDKLLYNCVNLNEVHLGDNIKYIGDEAFYGASSLINMEWSDQIESIGDYAFKETNFTGEVVLGANLKYIGVGAFQNSHAMTSITIPSGLSVLNNYVFDGCTSLSEVVLASDEYTPNSKIFDIGIAAFRGTAISEFRIPYSVRTIKDSTFEDTPNLVSVYAYNNTTGTTRTEYTLDEETGQLVENQVSQGLQKITIKAFNNSVSFKELLLVDKDNIVESPSNRVTLPSTLQQLGEANTDSFIFSNTAIEVLDLTSAIRFIAPSLAKNASQLREVIIDEEARSILISTIYREAFMNCVALEQFVVPNTVRAINSAVFEGCISLTAVTLPTNTNYIVLDANLFRGCVSLAAIVIPNTIQAIKDRAFENCIALTAITIPSTVVAMGPNVFNGCDSDLQITIMTHNNNTANWNANWLGTSGLTIEDNVTYIPE
ncbi:MAG: leucine-rich repeat domain-containing protein [Bacilli bacterium]